MSESKRAPDGGGAERATAQTHVRATIVAADQKIAALAQSLAGTVALGEAIASPADLGRLAEDRYVNVRELGRGGMGRVDVHFDRALGRLVARKTVLEQRHARLLIAEAQICAQLEHPSIVPLYDVCVDGEGRPTYTMRVVKGRTLRDVLEERETEGASMGLSQLLGVLRQVCLAVEYAHTRGVVHRDLKPENIVVGEFGEVYVLDWGVAWVAPDSDIRRTATPGSGIVVAGSPGYMAPEQALGEAIDARTDVFALGVMLHEVLVGERPFDDSDLPSILQRIAKKSFPPLGLAAPGRQIPAVLDALVRACLRRDPSERPPNARFVADTIDRHLDTERDREERLRDADNAASDGEAALEAAVALASEANRTAVDAERELASTRPWETFERKQPAWERLVTARQQQNESARALARAETAFARALGRVSDHPRARAGLARMHYRQFEAAEEAGQLELMARHLDLARAYDDGDLALELADEGTLVVEASAIGLQVELARFEPAGIVLHAGAPRSLGTTPTERVSLQSGSYVVYVRGPAGVLRYPLVVRRAHAHHVFARMPSVDEVPAGMVFVPGGAFQAIHGRVARPRAMTLPDFAIGRFPVTLAEYSRFIDAIPDSAMRSRRTPGERALSGPLIERADGSWRLSERVVEGEGRSRVPRDRELELPTSEITWFDALAYARWMAESTGRDVRLPTDLEWDKAMRGADGRLFPMGNHLDPSFAKLRESRPEASQPEPIGSFPLDESPYGVRDLAGGVGDWTSTMVDDGPPPRLEDESDPVAKERQAYWRGANWGSSGAAGMRYPMRLSTGTAGVGFRLALSLDRHGSSRLDVEPMKR